MSFVRVFVRWGCSMATIATLAVPAYSADKKPKETAAAPEAAPSYYGPQPATENIDLTMYARIREEGFHHSHVMEFGGALLFITKIEEHQFLINYNHCLTNATFIQTWLNIKQPKI